MALKSVVVAFILLALVSTSQTRRSAAKDSFNAFSALVIDSRDLLARHGSKLTPLKQAALGVPSDIKPYDSLVLATEWVGSVCSTRKCNNGRPVNDKFFNIHGLWPNDKMNSANSPMDCGSSAFNLASLPADLKQQLDSSWNALYNPAQSFLSHEWSKHGTCWNPTPEQMSKVPADIAGLVSTGINAMQTNSKDLQVAYMRLTLGLGNKFNAYKALAAKNIIPSNTAKYQRNDMVNALSDAFGVKNFGLMCQKTANGDSLLTEVRLCIDRNYQATDCKSMNLGCANVISYPEWR